MNCTIGFDISAVDPNFKAHAARGIGRYVSELNHFFTTQADGSVKVVPFKQSQLLSHNRYANWINKLPCGKITLRQQLLFPLMLGNNGNGACQAFHFPAHMDAPSWGLKRYIITVLDLIPLILSDLYLADKPSWRFHIARWLEIKAIKNSTMILAISQRTADDVQRLLNINPERIVVTPLGVDRRFFGHKAKFDQTELRQKYQLPSDADIVLYVGGIDQRKNCKGLLQTFRRVISTRRSKNQAVPALVMAGKIQSDQQYPALLAQIKELDLQDFVFLPGYIPDEYLVKLFAASKVFFFPSLYEGFGLTPLEAMAGGLPVVSSNTSCMPEVLGDAAVLVNPNDYETAAFEVCSLLENPERAAEYRQRGMKRAALFTWERTGLETLKAYERFAKVG